MVAEKYKVQLEIFEGPLDLLLYLIKKEEVNIYDIPIERVTQQYLQYLEIMQMLDLDIAGEFVLMAATLMYIKSRMLLPPDEQPPMEQEEMEDPRLDLVRQLLEYKKFKDVAHELSQKELFQNQLFSRVAAHSTIGADQRQLDVSIFDLINAFSTVLKKIEAAGLREVYEDVYTVADKILAIKEMLTEKPSIAFVDLFAAAACREEVIATFLAVLELIRLREIRGFQEQPFGPILVEARRSNP